MSFNARKLSAQKSLIQYRHESQHWAEQAKHVYPSRAWKYLVKEADNCFTSIIFPQDNLVRKLFINEYCWVSHAQHQDYLEYLFQSVEKKRQSSFLTNLDLCGNTCVSSLIYMKLLTQTAVRKDLESFQLVLKHFLSTQKNAQHLLNHLLCYCIEFGEDTLMKVLFQHQVRIRPCPQQPCLESELHHAVRFSTHMIPYLINMPEIDINAVNDRNLTPLAILISDPIRNYCQKDEHLMQYHVQLFLDHHARVDTKDMLGQNLLQRCLVARLSRTTKMNLSRILAPLLDLTQRNDRDEGIVHTLFQYFDYPSYVWSPTRDLIDLVKDWASFGCYQLTKLDQNQWCPLFQIIVQRFYNMLQSGAFKRLDSPDQEVEDFIELVENDLEKKESDLKTLDSQDQEVQDLIELVELELENNEHDPAFFETLTRTNPSAKIKHRRPIDYIIWPQLFELIYKHKGMTLFNTPNDSMPGNLLFSNLALHNESMVKVCLQHDMPVFAKDKFLAQTKLIEYFHLNFLLLKPPPCRICERIECKKTCNQSQRYIEWQLVCTFWACGFFMIPHYFTLDLTHPVARLAYKWGTMQYYRNEVDSLETLACVFLRQYFLQNMPVNLVSCVNKLELPKLLKETLCLGLDFDWAFES